ncbi:MAG: RDD family protein [Methanomicrobiales archaeon]|nr:RDD family protein [Methanomicrobiales archaeon]
MKRFNIRESLKSIDHPLSWVLGYALLIIGLYMLGYSFFAAFGLVTDPSSIDYSFLVRLVFLISAIIIGGFLVAQSTALTGSSNAPAVIKLVVGVFLLIFAFWTGRVFIEYGYYSDDPTVVVQFLFFICMVLIGVYLTQRGVREFLSAQGGRITAGQEISAPLPSDVQVGRGADPVGSHEVGPINPDLSVRDEPPAPDLAGTSESQDLPPVAPVSTEATVTAGMEYWYEGEERQKEGTLEGEFVPCRSCGKSIKKETLYCIFCGDCVHSRAESEIPVDPHITQITREPPQYGIPTRARPWVRFFARSFDILIVVFVVGLIITLIARISPLAARVVASSQANPLVFNLALSLIALLVLALVEPVFINKWGATPGKWLLQTRVTRGDGQTLSFSEAYGRSFRVYLMGYALGIPLICFITLIFSGIYGLLLMSGLR